jgi:hypothetical protein
MQSTKKADSLNACVAALATLIERDCPETREALAEARTRFREIAEAEFGAPVAQEPGSTGAL